MGPVVYIGGLKLGSHTQSWYRVDVESMTAAEVKQVVVESKRKKRKKRKVVGLRPLYRWVSAKKPKKKIHRLKLYPCAEIKFWSKGSCTILGDDLYWFGLIPHTGPSGGPPFPSLELVKHSLSNAACPLSWEVLSCSSMSPTSRLAVVAPAGEKKLYVLRGTDKSEMNLCGEIYDLHSNTWENRKCSISSTPSTSFYHVPYVTEDNKEIMFYDLRQGSLLFFDLVTGELLCHEKHDTLVLWSKSYFPEHPLGLGGSPDIESLVDATLQGPACFSNNTLYWFADNLYLFGYDIKLRTWFKSPFLGDKFPTLTPVSFMDELNVPLRPFLVDLRNGKLLAIVAEGFGRVTVAPLTVSRSEGSLSVTVESFHPLSFDDCNFYPIAEMSMLKNTQSGTMRGPVKSAEET